MELITALGNDIFWEKDFIVVFVLSNYQNTFIIYFYVFNLSLIYTSVYHHLPTYILHNYHFLSSSINH